MKLPYIKWYFRDAAADLRLLDAVPRCVWYEMLWLMAAADRYGYLEWAGHPMTDIEIARASGLTADEIAAARPVLIAAGIPSVEPETGAWFCRRMVDDEARRQKAIEDGKRGGNPSLASLPVATELLQNPEPRTHISLTPPLTPTLKGQGKERVKRERFVPPTPNEAIAYMDSIGKPIDGEAFVDYWQGQGWKRKGGPVVDWKATARTWYNNMTMEEHTALASKRAALQRKAEMHAGEAEARERTAAMQALLDNPTPELLARVEANRAQFPTLSEIMLRKMAATDLLGTISEVGR